MKVLDLQCQQQHAFEGWFGSEEEYQSQLKRGLVECPLCGDANITKMLSAPRINLGKTRDTGSKPSQNDAQGLSGPTSRPSEVATTSAKPVAEQRPPLSAEA